MNPKKPKLSKSDLSSFFNNCLRPSQATQPTKPLKATDRTSLPSLPTPLPAKLVNPRYFCPSVIETGRKTLHSKPSPAMSPLILKSPPIMSSPTEFPSAFPILNTKRRLSNVNSNSNSQVALKMEVFQRIGSRKSLYHIAGSVKHKRSKEGQGEVAHVSFRQPITGLGRPLPSQNNLKDKDRHPGKSRSTHRPEQPTRRSSAKPTTEMARIQNKKEFRDNFLDSQGNLKHDKSKANFENYVHQKSGFLHPKLSIGLPRERLELSQSKVSRLDKMVRQVIGLGKSTQEAGTSKPFRSHYDVNLLNSNMGDILKDIAKREILEGQPRTKPKTGQPANGIQEQTMKKEVIKETVRMMREHLFFENFLQLLGEKGVDVENLFSFCNQRMSIGSKTDLEVQTTEFRPESTMASVSEVSLMDVNSLTKTAADNRSPTIQPMDFSKLRRYSSTDSEADA